MFYWLLVINLGLIKGYYIKFINMGTFISVYSVSSINKNINLKIGNTIMNLLEMKRKFNGLAMIINRTKEEQLEMDRLEALIKVLSFKSSFRPNTSKATIKLLREQQEQLERDVAHDRALIESSASVDKILKEMLSTLKVNLETLKEIEEDYNKTS